MFLLKKTITPLIYPLSIIAFLLLAGLAMLWLTKKQKAGKITITLATCLLLVFSYEYVPDLLLASLENRYPSFPVERSDNPIPPVRWVVVLGGGYTVDPTVSAADQLSSASLKRIIEGIRIHKSMAGSRLVLSGGPVYYSEPEAKVMMKAAKLLDIDEKNVVLETLSRDTEEQALNIKQITGKDRLVLVTSAYHMQRSLEIFKSYGLSPIAAPADRLIIAAGRHVRPQSFYPSVHGLYKTAIAIHEYMGLGWHRLKLAIMTAT